MSFVERVIEHVRRVQQIAQGGARDKRVVINHGRHEAHALELLQRRKPGPSGRHYDDSERWLTDRLEWFVEELHWVLLAGAASELNLDERAALVDLGITLAARAPHDEFLGHPWITPLRLEWLTFRSVEIRSLSTSWWDLFESMTWPRIPRYCAELGLTDEEQGACRVTSAGELLLRLRGRDAVKWLLALEVQRTAGRRDQWRASTELLSELVAQRGLVHGTAPRHHDQPEDTSWIHLEKLSAMGIVEAIEEEGFASEGWQLTPLGEALLEEVAKGPEDPIGVLAQAIHEDELMVVVESRASAPTQTNEHVGAMLLHARMVAHEVRNALGPVQHASRALRSTVRDDTALTNAVELLDAIDRGVNRLHRFVTEAVRLVPPESRRVEPFSVLDAIADARKELGPDGVGSLNVETVPASADPLCHGNRGHFVLAMLNVLRNAQQAKGPDVRIAIRVDARNSSQVLLTIDDDGPGVPDAVREHIFENGVSYRQDGTGHGLASLRAVVEDIGGKVRCTTSELGGARFEIMLPAAEDSP